MVLLCTFAYYLSSCFFFFFFNDTATTEIYTLSLHDALPIFTLDPIRMGVVAVKIGDRLAELYSVNAADRKSTRLNSSHANISYAVFCLKKKKIVNEFASLHEYLLAHFHML